MSLMENSFSAFIPGQELVESVYLLLYKNTARNVNTCSAGELFPSASLKTWISNFRSLRGGLRAKYYVMQMYWGQR